MQLSVVFQQPIDNELHHGKAERCVLKKELFGFAFGQCIQPTVGATYDCCSALLVASKDSDFSEHRSRLDGFAEFGDLKRAIDQKKEFVRFFSLTDESLPCSENLLRHVGQQTLNRQIFPMGVADVADLSTELEESR